MDKQRQVQKLNRTLTSIKNLDDNNIDCYLMFGTLLGVVRENNCIWRR